MGNFNNSIVSYIDWNIALNIAGGPNWAATGHTDAPIITSEDFTKFYKQPSFYVMAHFSKFISPGSIRVDARVFESSEVTALAFLRPDSRISVILYNSDPVREIGVTIQDKNNKCMQTAGIDIKVKPKSINTYVYCICQL